MGGLIADKAARHRQVERLPLIELALEFSQGIERIETIKEKLFAGMARRGLVGAAADRIYTQILSFANFGFAESHSLSFALLVYASSWFKLHYPAAFLAGLLRAQPMGFYSPQSLVQDARRHGVEVLRPCIVASGARAGLERRPALKVLYATGFAHGIDGDGAAGSAILRKPYRRHELAEAVRRTLAPAAAAD